MVSRRILTSLTILSALLLIASLGLVAHNQGGRAEQPVRIELTRSLANALEDLGARTAAVAEAADLAGVREARQEMARTVLRFDQDLLTLAETVKDRRAAGAVAEIQQIWRELGLDLADLAAGEFAASSAAGREAIVHLRRQTGPLRQYLQDVTAALRGVDRDASQQGRQAATAAVVFGGLTVLLGLVSLRPQRPAPAPPPRVRQLDVDDLAPAMSAPAAEPADVTAAPSPAATHRGPAAYSRPEPPLSARGDLGLASAAVDRVSVDMLTITRSTERMQQAVDSVTASLQGMLFSLNELAQDSHEGARITRTANNAAVYAADTARELLETAREMGAVVARVRSLAARSQEIAGRIETEAAATGATGEAFTSVVAQEVKQLAMATGDSTSHIETAVDGILAGQRQYEEAIGQIIKNVSQVRRVAANLGELMLEPPARVQPGPAYQAPQTPPTPPAADATAAATAPAATGNPASAPQSPPAAEAPEPGPAEPAPATAAEADEVEAELEPISPEQTARIEELNAVTDSLLDELAEVAAENAPGAESAAETDQPEPASPAEPAAESVPAAAPEPVAAADTTADETEAEAPANNEPDPTPSGSNGNVFMLNRPKPAPEPAPAAAEPEAPAPDAEPAPEAAAETAGPQPEPQPAPPTPGAEEAEEADRVEEPEDQEEGEPVGAGTGPARPRPVAQGASGNIFMLNKPKK